MFSRCFIKLSFLFCVTQAKYIDGEINTHENWAFLARFCFLSELGEYEYNFEFEDDQTARYNLLMYYDTDDQWPAVYKTNKTCWEKESVLHIEQNQIVNLSAKYPQRELSGCYYVNKVQPNPTRRYTITIPTITYRTRATTLPTTATTGRKRITTVSTTEKDILSTTESENSTTEIAFTESTLFSTFDDNETTMSTYKNTITTRFSSSKKVPVKKRSLEFTRIKVSRKVVCHNSRGFRSSRERWWFMAISNCNGTNGIHLKYKILMTNGPDDDYWHHHFSADEFYILPILMVFIVVNCFMVMAIVVCSIELKTRQLLHTTYKMFVVSVVLHFFGVLMQAMAYLKYAINGMGFPKLKMTGSVFMAASETCFLLLLLLLAKGYTITRGRLPVAASIKLTVFMCVYITTYLSLFIYEAKVFDPGEVLYLYESPAGYGLIILRICAWCMFIYSTIFTLKHYPEKANFYYPFNICGTLWCVAGPAFILSANTYIDKWVRESVVCGVLLFIAFAGHFMFLVLTLPSVANKNFPYHVRTSQIGVMEITGVSGVNTIEQFGHHIYEPSNGVTETVIIPLTRRTEEILGNIYTQRVPRNASFRSNRGVEAEIGYDCRDAAMENVLQWSMARNLQAIEDRTLEANERSGRGSPESRATDAATDSRRTSLNTTRDRYDQQNNRYLYDDYMKEVPIELFTVSRMVLSNGEPKTAKEDKEQ